MLEYQDSLCSNLHARIICIELALRCVQACMRAYLCKYKLSDGYNLLVYTMLLDKSTHMVQYNHQHSILVH
jgi:hypothetical protein